MSALFQHICCTVHCRVLLLMERTLLLSPLPGPAKRPKLSPTQHQHLNTHAVVAFVYRSAHVVLPISIVVMLLHTSRGQ
jgi:hypothetical protein